jgi:hypothetical protein
MHGFDSFGIVLGSKNQDKGREESERRPKEMLTVKAANNDNDESRRNRGRPTSGI